MRSVRSVAKYFLGSEQPWDQGTTDAKRYGPLPRPGEPETPLLHVDELGYAFFDVQRVQAPGDPERAKNRRARPRSPREGSSGESSGPQRKQPLL